ncbi:hypothetical protein GSUET_26950 [Geobacter sulfurreducens subsp. ethanolicus]|uniref:hypothetical protein n=1 Tax=Geobacter sulfurreducens TaxID=35554 RepID=UPI00257453F2|nr:hypothetical protein [Geobacter sulfurreducens]BEH11083.1 hypothetical protein GSUET_26950 [Geobacter sulfurreducens subsp. ethanolicus]
MNQSTRIVVGIISLFLSLFLAWRIGIWLEPAPAGPSLPAGDPKSPPYATGTVQEDLHFEIRNVRISGDGATLNGIGIIRFDTDRERIKPAVLAMLTAVKKKAPAAKMITLELKPAVECTQCTLARATYREGRTVIRYGIPSQEQIERHNALIGTTDGTGRRIDRPRLYRPDKETFGAGLAVTMALEAARQKNPSAGEEQLLDQAAATVGISPVVAARHRDFMKAYFTGDGYGEETLDTPLQ